MKRAWNTRELGTIVDTLSSPIVESPSLIRIRRLLPVFWTLLMVISYAAVTVNVIVSHPDKVAGWRGAGLGVLIIGMLSAYRLLSMGRIYRNDGISERKAMILISLQLLALIVLVRGYDALFVWFGVAVLYQIIGGLSKRRWMLQLTGLAVVFIISFLPAGQRSTDIGLIFGVIILVTGNIGVALFLRAMDKQHAHLSTTFERLRQAYTALTISSTQAEELAVLRERTRLAQVMHDEIGHALVVINIKLEAAQLLYGQDKARGDAELEATRTLIRRTMTDLRHAIADLRAPVVDYDDLPSALQRLGQETQARTGIEVACHVSPEPSVLPIDTRKALWYVAREALTNIEKHASASHISITLDCLADCWMLRIEDNGSGIQPADLDTTGHYGILGMRERMYSVGGTLSVEHGMKAGTVVEARVPVHTQIEVEMS